MESCARGSLTELGAYHHTAECRAALAAVDECIAVHHAVAEQRAARAAAEASAEPHSADDKQVQSVQSG